jgi:hypothetical protein
VRSLACGDFNQACDGAASRKLFMNNIPLNKFMENNVIFGNILQPYIELNKRQHDRFIIGKVLYVLMSWSKSENDVFLGQLLDFNKEGCGISYMTVRSAAESFLSQKTCKLRFIRPFKEFELRKNTVVYDNELIENSTERISVRRCGIKFDDFVIVKDLL